MEKMTSSSSSSIRSGGQNLVLGVSIIVFAVLFCVFIPALPLISAQDHQLSPFASPYPSPSPSPFPSSTPDSCFNSILNMSDCLTYVESGSNLTKPEKGCCPALAGLVESSPICLCQLLGNGGSSFGIQLNINRAINLPKVCKVDTPPISLCSAVGVPVSVPTSSEGPNISPGGGGGGAGPVSSSSDMMMPPALSAKGGSSSTLIRVRDYYSSSSSISLIFFCILIGLSTMMI